MCKDKQNNEETKYPLWIWIILAIGCIIVLWVASWCLIDNFVPVGERGVFGDKFGAINSLFSGLAFAGLIVTLLFQKEELKLQRDELAETRNELKAQKLEFQEQNKTMKRQRFENTFFNMLSLENEIVSSLSLSNFYCEADLPNGRLLFKELYLKDFSIYTCGCSCHNIKDTMKDLGIDKYSQIDGITCLNHYFRHLYRIYRFIDKSDFEENEKFEYATIVTALLSEYELLILFYYCLNENKGFKELIEKYSLFENLRIDLLAKPEHKEEYAESAYEQRFF